MDIEVFEGTQLAKAVGGDKVAGAALYHHQAIETVGDGLRVAGVSPDGIIEAIELENHPFGIAVQWHPEQTLEKLDLFEALISAAKIHRGAK
jgi:putative glutamine amidotransferase